MAKEDEDVKKASKQLGENVKEEHLGKAESMAKQMIKKAALPKDAMGLSDNMVEGIYSQAYRLYNTGKYKDASQLFRLLLMLNTSEGKYAMGLAACFHMLKEFGSAIESYALCGLMDPENPIPHFHSSDCYLQMGDPTSAIIALEMAVQRSTGKPQFATLRDRAIMTIEGLKQQIGIPVAKTMNVPIPPKEKASAQKVLKKKN